MERLDDQDMFIRYYVELPMGFGRAEDALLRSPQSLMRDLATGAHERAESLLSEVGFDVGNRRLTKRVVVEMREPVRFGSKTALPMTWQAFGAEALFPSMEADIEIAPLGRRCTQLAISVRYRPPLGVLGRALDRALLHRVAEAAVKDFLDHVARALLETVAA
jgi:hypothetical protein